MCLVCTPEKYVNDFFKSKCSSNACKYFGLLSSYEINGVDLMHFEVVQLAGDLTHA